MAKGNSSSGSVWNGDLASNFHVELVGGSARYSSRSVGDFTSVQGLSRTVDPFVLQEGGRSSPHLRLQPGRFGQVVMRWGTVYLSTFLDWMRAVDTGQSFRRDVYVFHLNREFRELRVYTLYRAWPVEWRAGEFDSGQSQLATEELHLAYEGLDVKVTGKTDWSTGG